MLKLRKSQWYWHLLQRLVSAALEFIRLLCDCLKAAIKLRESCVKASFSAGFYKAALKPAFLQLCGKASFSTVNTHVPIMPAFAKHLRSFEMCAKAVEKLCFFSQGNHANFIHFSHNTLT